MSQMVPAQFLDQKLAGHRYKAEWFPGLAAVTSQKKQKDGLFGGKKNIFGDSPFCKNEWKRNMLKLFGCIWAWLKLEDTLEFHCLLSNLLFKWWEIVGIGIPYFHTVPCQTAKQLLKNSWLSSILAASTWRSMCRASPKALWARLAQLDPGCAWS